MSAEAPAVGFFGLLSGLLVYPDEEWRAELEALGLGAAELTSRRGRRSIREFLTRIEDMAPAELERHYVEVFDFDRRATLHMTFHRYGDRRERGTQLARLVGHYAQAGFEIAGGELPDYLPVVLEFADLAHADRSATVLNELREPIELVRERLGEVGSPYAALFDALCGELPSLSRAQRQAIRTLAEAEPPVELVGLPTYGDEAVDAALPSECGPT